MTWKKKNTCAQEKPVNFSELVPKHSTIGKEGKVKCIRTRGGQRRILKTDVLPDYKPKIKDSPVSD